MLALLLGSLLTGFSFHYRGPVKEFNRGEGGKGVDCWLRAIVRGVGCGGL